MGWLWFLPLVFCMCTRDDVLASEPEKTSEHWECWRRYDGDRKIVVRLTRQRIGGKDIGKGTIVVAEEQTQTRFGMTGVFRDWNWGVHDTLHHYTWKFLIRPDGLAAIYDFFGLRCFGFRERQGGGA